MLDNMDWSLGIRSASLSVVVLLAIDSVIWLRSWKNKTHLFQKLFSSIHTTQTKTKQTQTLGVGGLSRDFPCKMYRRHLAVSSCSRLPSVVKLYTPWPCLSYFSVASSFSHFSTDLSSEMSDLFRISSFSWSCLAFLDLLEASLSSLLNSWVLFCSASFSLKSNTWRDFSTCSNIQSISRNYYHSTSSWTLKTFCFRLIKKGDIQETLLYNHRQNLCI